MVLLPCLRGCGGGKEGPADRLLSAGEVGRGAGSMSKLKTEDSRGGDLVGAGSRAEAVQVLGADANRRARTMASPRTLEESEVLEAPGP